MNIEKLNEIIKYANIHSIAKCLKAAGFHNCKYGPRFRKASLYDIAMASYQKTLYYPDGAGKEYVADLCHGVKGYEQYEFVVVQLLAPFARGCEDLSTKKMLIYAKEVTK